MKHSIIITGFNCVDYVKQCVESCLNQTVTPHQIMVWNDASTDYTEKILEQYEDNPLVIVHNNETNMGALYGRVRMVSIATGDVCSFLGMDDYLERNALEVLNKYYEDDNIQMTYGSWHVSNGRKYIAEPYSDDVWRDNSFRTSGWKATALNTFKTSLLKQVPDNVLRGHNGQYFDNCTDLAYSFPCLEMIQQNQCSVVTETIYFYRHNHANVTLNRFGRAHKTAIREQLKRMPKQNKLQNV